LFANIQNLFDTPPPPAATGNGPGPGFAAGDDVRGRYLTLGVRYKR
jgi:outer membrane receptor protein involved in Fe transport